LVATHAPISHLWFEFLTLSPHTLQQLLTFGLNFSLFQQSSHFSLASRHSGAPQSQHVFDSFVGVVELRKKHGKHGKRHDDDGGNNLD
jgi:hypothetical protein